jgi:ribosome-binding factor A
LKYRQNIQVFLNSLLNLVHICKVMSVRQEKFAGLIQQHIAEILQRNKAWVNNEFVTISKVQVSPDLGYAKIYLSLFTAPNKQLLLDTVKFHSREIRKQLAAKIKNQARIVPELEFFIDDSLDYVFHMEEVFKKIQSKDQSDNKE